MKSNKLFINLLMLFTASIFSKGYAKTIPFDAKTFANYIGKTSDFLKSDLTTKGAESSNGKFRVTLNNIGYLLSPEANEENKIESLILKPEKPQEYRLENWKDILKGENHEHNDWGNFLGCKFSGSEFGLKRTIDETITLAETHDWKTLRITPIFNPVSGIYVCPEINKTEFQITLTKSYYDLNVLKIANYLDGSYQDFYQRNYYISNMINAWGVNYIYFAYVRDKNSTIYNMNVNADAKKEKIYEISIYLNKEDNANNKKAKEIWLMHAKDLTSQIGDAPISIYSTNTAGEKTHTFRSLKEAEEFLLNNDRQNGVILSFYKNNAKINLIINAKNTYILIQHTPANIELTFDKSKSETISFEANSKNKLFIDWGDNTKTEVKPGLISGKILSSTGLIKIYGTPSSIDCSSANVKKIALHNLPDLKNLSFSGNGLEILDIDECTNINYLDCEKNKLKTLETYKNPLLEKLLCSENSIAVIDLGHLSHLKRFTCIGNNLQTLDLTSNPALEHLNIKGNKISTLDLSNNTKLQWLILSQNMLSSIDISNCKELVKFDCSENRLESIDMSNSKKLEFIVLTKNNIKNLSLAELPNLQEFIADKNQIEHIDFEKMPNVMRLNISANKIGAIDLTANGKIRDLYIYDNPIKLGAFNKIVETIYSRKGESIAGNIYLLSTPMNETIELSEDGYDNLKEKNWELFIIEKKEGENVEKTLTKEAYDAIRNQVANTILIKNPGMNKITKVYSLDGTLILSGENIEVNQLPKGTFILSNGVSTSIYIKE